MSVFKGAGDFHFTIHYDDIYTHIYIYIIWENVLILFYFFHDFYSPVQVKPPEVFLGLPPHKLPVRPLAVSSSFSSGKTGLSAWISDFTAVISHFSAKSGGWGRQLSWEVGSLGWEEPQTTWCHTLKHFTNNQKATYLFLTEHLWSVKAKWAVSDSCLGLHFSQRFAWKCFAQLPLLAHLLKRFNNSQSTTLSPPITSRPAKIRPPIRSLS